ncbi:MAG: type II secretion system F family protein [Pirellulaceae bacterium]|nr:type II secretion system F family protein [Pirellulaceae bacterium]MDG1809921.1 type II secretion system F family protein [Pirellulaceae bacterium]MDG2105184.1 type II secretion system F family protein [Pirellulaceae bacterium]
MVFPFLLLVVIAVAVSMAWKWYVLQASVAARLSQPGDVESDQPLGLSELSSESSFANWLFRAGFRSPKAPLVFWGATILLGVTGLILMYSLAQQGVFAIASQAVSSIPGGVGNVMIPVVLGAPWIIWFVLTLTPTLVVRSVRRNRVKSIEQDLPLLLDLLNTLAQAGIGFDSALDQILSVQNPSRPLVQELRLFQFDNLAGRSRIESLRRLMRRVHVPLFSSFISAIVQAEQTGSGIGRTLRTQALEIRARRREKAAAAAMMVPTKLVVPMVIGFLPGVFVVLLGPILFEALGALEQSFRGPLGQ